MINRLFRKYHRWLAVVFAVPLFTTIVTGIGFPIAKLMHQRQLAEFLIQIHTLEIFGLGEEFPIINGIGLLGLLVTGFSMTSFFKQRRTI